MQARLFLHLLRGSVALKLCADVDYILETFPIVKRKDEQALGEYPGPVISNSLSGRLELPRSRKIREHTWSYGDHFS